MNESVSMWVLWDCVEEVRVGMGRDKACIISYGPCPPDFGHNMTEVSTTYMVEVIVLRVFFLFSVLPLGMSPCQRSTLHLHLHLHGLYSRASGVSLTVLKWNIIKKVCATKNPVEIVLRSSAAAGIILQIRLILREGAHHVLCFFVRAIPAYRCMT